MRCQFLILLLAAALPTVIFCDDKEEKCDGKMCEKIKTTLEACVDKVIPDDKKDETKKELKGQLPNNEPAYETAEEVRDKLKGDKDKQIEMILKKIDKNDDDSKALMTKIVDCVIEDITK